MRTGVVISVIVIIVLLIAAAMWFSRPPAVSEETDTFSQEDFGSGLLASPSPVVRSPAVIGTATPTTTVLAPGAVREFTVTGSNFKFSPATMQVDQGDTVRVTLVSGDMMHDIVFEDFNVRTKVLPVGQRETIEFVADKTGEFEYYCSVGNHRAMGMVGRLTVQ